MLYETYHEMQVIEVNAAGAEEWYCPTCGRRLSVFWTPEFKKSVLEDGDNYAIHSGSKGGLSLWVPGVGPGG